ncbi:hypothetical protein BH09VER1_BH09VER1_36200 [soil metagenome]
MRGYSIQGPPLLYGRQAATRAGFSLIELLVVLAVISILTTLGAKVLAGGSGLQTAGISISDFALMARNEAISQNSTTALVFKNAGSEAFRSYCILTLKRPTDGSQLASTNWVQGTPWKTLPVRVRFENSGGANDVFKTNSAFYPPLPTTSYRGEPVAPSSLSVVLFSPDGQVRASGIGDSAELYMIEDLPGHSLTNSRNWVKIDFNRATGNVRMTQP